MRLGDLVGPVRADNRELRENVTADNGNGLNKEDDGQAGKGSPGSKRRGT